MNKAIHISSNNKINYEVEKYTKPEFIYIPLENKTGSKYKCLIKEGEYVYKGQIVATEEKINFPIHASVSGYFIHTEDKLINSGKKVKTMVIENDFKEKYEEKTKEDKLLTKDTFIDSLRSHGITGLGGSDFPTFLKYKIDNPKYLLINGVECEPFVSCDKCVMHNYADNILEAVDNIMEVMGIEKGIVVIKESDTSSNNALKKYIGTYPNISIYKTTDAYPNGWERNAVRNALGIEYDKYPTEKKIIVSNVSTVYAIYKMLKYDKPLTERIITLTGVGIKKKINIEVKIGTLISEVLENLDEYKNIKNPLFIAGGPMMGSSLPTDELVVTKDLNSVMIIDDHFEKNLPCIKCGKCTEVCPVNIMPVFIMKNCDNIKALKNLTPEKCIECGLCSYICPSRIEVREFVRIAKEKVNNIEKI